MDPPPNTTQPTTSSHSITHIDSFHDIRINVPSTPVTSSSIPSRHHHHSTTATGNVSNGSTSSRVPVSRGSVSSEHDHVNNLDTHPLIPPNPSPDTSPDQPPNTPSPYTQLFFIILRALFIIIIRLYIGSVLIYTFFIMLRLVMPSIHKSMPHTTPFISLSQYKKWYSSTGYGSVYTESEYGYGNRYTYTPLSSLRTSTGDTIYRDTIIHITLINPVIHSSNPHDKTSSQTTIKYRVMGIPSLIGPALKTVMIAPLIMPSHIITTNTSNDIYGCKLPTNINDTGSHMNHRPVLTNITRDMILNRITLLRGMGIPVTSFLDTPSSPSIHQSNTGSPIFVSLVPRGQCPFDQKILTLQKQGSNYVIVYNTPQSFHSSHHPNPSSSSSSSQSNNDDSHAWIDTLLRMSSYMSHDTIHIASTFITHADGQHLISHLNPFYSNFSISLNSSQNTDNMIRDSHLIVQITMRSIPVDGLLDHHSSLSRYTSMDHPVSYTHRHQSTSKSPYTYHPSSISSQGISSILRMSSYTILHRITTHIIHDLLFLFISVTTCTILFIMLCLILSLLRNLIVTRQIYLIETGLEAIGLLVVYAGVSNVMMGVPGLGDGIDSDTGNVIRQRRIVMEWEQNHRRLQRIHRTTTTILSSSDTPHSVHDDVHHHDIHDDTVFSDTSSSSSIPLDLEDLDDISWETYETLITRITMNHHVNGIPGGGFLTNLFGGPGLFGGNSDGGVPRLTHVTFPLRILTEHDIIDMKHCAKQAMTSSSIMDTISHINMNTNTHHDTINKTENIYAITSDLCAICIDDYIAGSRIRTLPCHHTFHDTCIDPWLLNHHRTCPICKRDVMEPSIHCTMKQSNIQNGDNEPNDNETVSITTCIIILLSYTVTLLYHFIYTIYMFIQSIPIRITILMIKLYTMIRITLYKSVKWIYKTCVIIPFNLLDRIFTKRKS